MRITCCLPPPLPPLLLLQPLPPPPTPPAAAPAPRPPALLPLAAAAAATAAAACGLPATAARDMFAASVSPLEGVEDDVAVAWPLLWPPLPPPLPWPPAAAAPWPLLPVLLPFVSSLLSLLGLWGSTCGCVVGAAGTDTHTLCLETFPLNEPSSDGSRTKNANHASKQAGCGHNKKQRHKKPTDTHTRQSCRSVTTYLAGVHPRHKVVGAHDIWVIERQHERHLPLDRHRGVGVVLDDLDCDIPACPPALQQHSTT